MTRWTTRKCVATHYRRGVVHRIERNERRLLPGKPVRAFREYDQESVWRQPVPPVKAREPYDNEVVKRGTAEITRTTTQREFANRSDRYV